MDIQNTDPNPGDVSSAENALPAETPEAQIAGLSAERDRLATEAAETYDRYLRLKAEFENFRRRSERDRSEFLQFAATEVVRELLPIVDDFERALKVECADKEYTKGVELIYQRLLEALKRAGLEPLDTAGKLFDPNIHQAVERVESADAEDQAILAEYQRGYNFKGRLLRPAMVRVAVKP